MFLSPFRSVLGRRPRTIRRNDVRLRVSLLEDRTTPTVLSVGANFTPDPAHNRFNSIQAAVNAAQCR